MKACGQCGHEKPLSEFHRRGSGRQAWCKLCRSAHDAQREHGEREQALKVAVRKGLNEWYAGLKDGPCADCGQRYHPAAMQWDHRPGEEKLFTIGSSRYVARARLLAEIAKCDLVCANCHAIRTWERGSGSVLDVGRIPAGA